MIAWLAAFALTAAASEAAPTITTEGPWRQLIRFEPTLHRPDGISLWISEGAVLPPDGPATRNVRAVKELWVAHGAITGGQAFVVRTNRYDCGGGAIHTDRIEVFGRDGRLLGDAGPVAEPEYIQTHSAEAEVERAVCTGSRIAARGAVAPTLTDAVARMGAEREVEAGQTLHFDVDYDGQPDTVSIAMRPHSMRHDVEFVLASQANRTINVVTAEQPATGPLVQRLIRPLERDRYLIACRMSEGRDVTPCVSDYPLVQRGVEVVTPGQPTVIVWLAEGEPHVARLP
ncbi:MAG: hypothetical protein EON91_11455 [Brevundimonas sp.]|uniref:hypothetical protein n=1 Tax=Brevundimonas sp. TaxID=1871086 RepID=UPI001207D058|nr:hypothetical protein [Brevundimonas sp.]RZJ16877.1 MAG: hypothetical protein EON91_11455 [Brevundimonas sp.]